MDRLSYLEIEFENVSEALAETLRHDYGIDRSRDYYEECISRLDAIKQRKSDIRAGDRLEISEMISELHAISNLICFIERSHLGEFSWPFANIISKMADIILTEAGLVEDLKPILGVVSEGSRYSINYEYSFARLSTKRQFVFIVFPRSLKHNVLFHSLFGHELAHTALNRDEPGRVLNGVLAAFAARGPLKDANSLNVWLHSAEAPSEIRSHLKKLEKDAGSAFQMADEDLSKWRIELLCDIFGLLLFGPSFIAAHRVSISFRELSPYQFSKTHPPYEIRHNVLQSTMRILGWDTPILVHEGGDFFSAETDFLDFLMKPNYGSWASVIDHDILSSSVEAISNYFALKNGLSYQIPTPEYIKSLLKRLEARLPPLQEDISETGSYGFANPHIGQTLYAAWLFWLGRAHLKQSGLTFGEVNKLTDHSLLQQEAIDRFRIGG